MELSARKIEQNKSLDDELCFVKNRRKKINFTKYYGITIHQIIMEKDIENPRTNSIALYKMQNKILTQYGNA